MLNLIQNASSKRSCPDLKKKPPGAAVSVLQNQLLISKAYAEDSTKLLADHEQIERHEVGPGYLSPQLQHFVP